MDFELKGMRELRRDLREVPAKLARRILRRSTRRGAVVLQKAIRARAPVRSGYQGGKRVAAGTDAKGRRRPGFLRRNIRVFERRARGVERGKVFRYSVAPSRRAFYGRFVEEQAPFMVPAIEAAEEAAFTVVLDSIEAGLDEELTRAGWR